MFLSTRSALSLVCAGALSLSLSGITHADTPTQSRARREIAVAYQKMAVALSHKDVQGAAAFEAPDFQAFSATGRMVNREQGLAQLRWAFARAKAFPRVEAKIVSLTWRGSDAVVIAQNTVVVLVAQGGKSVRSEVVNTSRDYWSRNPVGWQMRQSVSRAAKMWINGQRVA